jgi:hypothetical protein
MVLRSLVLLAFVSVASAQAPITLREKSDLAQTLRVEVKTTIAGRLSLTPEPGKPVEAVTIEGASLLTYDERVLVPDEEKSEKVIRAYRTVEFQRKMNNQEQSATLREAIRRVVVLKNDKGKKAPFSPDGPLTWGEIDLIRHDIFAPVIAAGLLPARAVAPGDKWAASAAAVLDLTEFETIEDGGLSLEFISVIELDKRKYAKLAVGGTIRGRTEDGPVKQKLEGTAYFDIEAERVSYLKLSGVHEMLGAKGETTGTLEGTFTLTRQASTKFPEINDEALKTIQLKPNDDNSLLLYDNPELGIRFLHSRRWRMGVVQGRQLTLQESKGGGILFTIEPANRVPTAQQYLDEVKAFLAKQQAKLPPLNAPKRWAEKPMVIDRFGVDAELKAGASRLEYAVASSAEGGVLIAARFPPAETVELKADLDRVLKHLVLTKRIEVK